jgi:hypothetical protein
MLDNYRVFLQQPINSFLKENIMYYSEMNGNPLRVFIDIVQLYDAFKAAPHKNRSYKGEKR